MNLLQDPWLPVRRHDGDRAWIAPPDLSDPTLAAFDAPRPDFNGALAQFAIGLLQTVTPVQSNGAWRALFNNPPEQQALREWFAPIEPAFEFDGDGPRFMQDLTLTEADGAVNDVAALLIEAPGDQTLRNNADHFVKRGHVTGLCPCCAAAALLTLQINAPSGGAGHRTGLRGGGPLTTLVACQPSRSLWHDLWLNVLDRPAFERNQSDIEPDDLYRTFPWLTDISALQKPKGELAPVQVHAAHVFWAMPRRIRLDLEKTGEGECSICGRASNRLVQRYVTKNYGLNYKGAWLHPLSPYYENKEEWLPQHPQPSGFGYRHWLGWVLGVASDAKKRYRAASVVTKRMTEGDGQLRLWAFGYDMDNMKARAWCESSLPLYGLPQCAPSAQRRVEEAVRFWLAGAEMGLLFLRTAVKQAWFGDEARGDFGMIDASFWSRTEAPFYRQLRQFIEAARVDGDLDEQALAEAWLDQLHRAALDLFDSEFVGAGVVERQNPRRVAQAFRQLKRNFGGKKMRSALGLPPKNTGSSRKAA
ncbi:MAG: type I-E CRISPR-associated protein Cse1/CasA [Pseudomonadota bacterium]|nr:type I-E CRISPR-associated protein Cse1/CasA [Pseudomonadota bacterium]